MPIFTIKDEKTGRSIDVSGDRAPTKDEEREIIANLPSILQEESRPRFTPTPYGVGGGVSVAPPPNLEEATATMLRYGVPTVAALGTGGASLLAQVGAQALTSGLGEMGARAVEGQDVLSREGLAEAGKAAGYSLIPGRKQAKILETTATMAGSAALAEAIGSAISGELISKEGGIAEDAAGKMFKAGAISSGLGLGISGLSRGTGRMLSAAQDSARKRELLREVGIDKPVLSQINPEYAPMTNRMGAIYSDIGDALNSTESNISRELFDKIGNIPTNSEIADKVLPMVRKAQDIESGLKQAKNRQAQAKAMLERLEASPAQTADWQNAYEAAALEQLDAARRQASATFAIQNGFGEAASLTSHADDLTRTIGELDSAITSISKSLYSKTGLDPSRRIVSRDSLIKSAKSTLGDNVDTPVGQQIISSIEDVGKVDGVADPMLSWNQFMYLRDEIGSRLANFSPYKGRSEALASEVYKELGKEFRSSVEKSVGVKGLKDYDAAQAFWSEWTGTRDSNFTKDIFTDRRLDPSKQRVMSGITTSTLQSLADGVVKGEVQAIRNVTNAIDLVKRFSPEAADSMRASVGRAVRGAMIDKYKNDPSGLILALSEQASKEDILPFIHLAGFGKKQNLDLLAKAVRKYEKADITPEVLDSALSAADVVLGLDIGVIKKKANDAAALAVVGANELASKRLSEARNTATKANRDADEATKAFNEMVNNPILSVFTGRGKYTFTEEAGKVGKGTITDFVKTLSPKAGQRFMGALRQKDPQFADLISRKLLADELYRISGVDRNAVDAATSIDFDKLRALFKPSTPQDVERANHMRLLVGDIFDTRLKTFLNAFEKVAPELKKAQLIKRDSGAPVVSTVAGAAQPFIQIPGLSALGASAITTRIIGMLQKPRFDLLTYMATDPNFLKMTTKADRLSKALNTFPIQRTYLYLANAGLLSDMAAVDSEFIRPQPTR